MEKTLGIGLAFSVLLSLPFTIGATFFPELLMRAFASDPVLIQDGAVYLRVVGVSYLLLSVSQIYLCILKNCGKAVLSAVISSVSVIINIILNAAFIFGIGFFPEMGIAGAAVATVIAKVIELAWALAVMLKKDSIKMVDGGGGFANAALLVRNCYNFCHAQFFLPGKFNCSMWNIRSHARRFPVHTGTLTPSIAHPNRFLNHLKRFSAGFLTFRGGKIKKRMVLGAESTIWNARREAG